MARLRVPGGEKVDRDEHAIAAELLPFLDEIPRLGEVHTLASLKAPSDDSDLAADNVMTDPFQMVTMTQNAQNMAVDALRAVHQLVRDDTGITLPQFAHYPLLRTVMEASSQTIWLLSPDDQRERVLRLLKAHASEMGYDAAVVGAMAAGRGSDDQLDRSRKAEYLRHFSRIKKADAGRCRAIGDRMGIQPHEYQGHQVKFGPLLEQAAEAIGDDPNVTRSTWQLISGLTHPSTTRATQWSVLEEVGPAGNGAVMVNMSSDIRVVQWALLRGMRLYLRAQLLLARRRGVEPSPEVQRVDDRLPMSRRP